MIAEEGEGREEAEASLQTGNSYVAGERCSGSCSSSEGTFSGEDSECREDQMVKIELDAARALADFAQLALLESENPNGESGGKWGNKGRRSRKRVKNEARDWGKDLEKLETYCSELRSLDHLQDHAMVGRRQRKKMCKNALIKTVKVEQDSALPSRSPMCMLFGGSKSKQNLTEDEKEARRLRRIIANRESARQTIRRRQAFCEELSRKAADLVWDNENMKREKELVMKEYQLLKDKNKHLKAQIVMTIKDEVKENSEEPTLTQVEPPTSSSTKLPLLIYNRPFFPPFLWPTIIHPSNMVQTQPVPENATLPKETMPITCKPNPLHEQGNLPNLSGPRAPFYVSPYPWFFPPDHWSRLHPQPLDPCGLKEKRDGTSVDNQHDEGSSSEAMGNVGNNHLSLVKEVKTDASTSTEANCAFFLPETSIGFPTGGQLLGPHPKGVVLTPMPLRAVKPTPTVKCENEFQTDSTSKEEAVFSTSNYTAASPEKMHGPSLCPNKKLVDAAAAAEARKRRKELTQLKNLHSRQLRLHS